MTVARQQMERDAPKRARTELIESTLAFGVLLLTLAIVAWTAATIPAVSDSSGAQTQM